MTCPVMNASNHMPRSLSRLDATMLIVGNMIGIGIFTTTGYIAQYLEAPFWLFLVWIIGGIYAFCGALTYAELSTHFPYAGGDYHFLKSAYHPLIGFLFGWSTFTVTYTGSIATIAVGFATYFVNLLPSEWASATGQIPFLSLSITPVKVVAILITVIFTFINSLGVRRGAQFQNIFTLSGLGILFLFIILGFSSAKGNLHHFRPFFPGTISWENLSLLGVALVGVIFTYSGWTTIVYVAGEIKTPHRNIPAAMWLAVLVVATLYVLMNAVYLYATPLPNMENVVDIGYRVAEILFGGSIGLIFSLIIMILVLSTLNSTILSGARIYYAMALEGRFFKSLARLHPTYRVPVNSLWAQAGWSVLLILSGTFNQLLTYTVFIMVLFSLLSGVAVFKIRRQSGGSQPVYRTWGDPWVPAIYILFSSWILLNTLWHRPVESLLGIALSLTGIPFYWWWSRRGKKIPGN